MESKRIYPLWRYVQIVSASFPQSSQKFITEYVFGCSRGDLEKRLMASSRATAVMCQSLLRALPTDDGGIDLHLLPDASIHERVEVQTVCFLSRV